MKINKYIVLSLVVLFILFSAYLFADCFGERDFATKICKNSLFGTLGRFGLLAVGYALLVFCIFKYSDKENENIQM